MSAARRVNHFPRAQIHLSLTFSIIGRGNEFVELGSDLGGAPSDGSSLASLCPSPALL